jgi:hypothetical protein
MTEVAGLPKETQVMHTERGGCFREEMKPWVTQVRS